MGEGAVGIDVENWKRVFAVVHAAFGEDDRNEVDAGGSEEWERGGLGEKLSY